MQTIKRFSSKEMTTLATAATWLGNDHAHLVTKHPEFDLDQLKVFIHMLCQHIQSEKEYAKAINLISQTSKKFC